MGLALPAVGLLPANDDFADAELLTGPRGTRTGVNANAALEALEPQHAGIPHCQTSIWYSWQPVDSGPTRFAATASQGNAAGILAVYTGSEVGALTEVGSVAPTMISEPVQVDVHAEAGQTYHVAVAGVFASGSGRIQVQWDQALPCDGQTVTVALASGDTPTAAADVIRGTSGADTIDGGVGTDRICGDGGADTITGGAGPEVDRIFGDGGNDTLRGAGGNDRLDGGDENDRLVGDGGNDNLNGQAANDIILGGTGTDRLKGGTQDDNCNGGPQADTHSGCEVRTNIP